MHRHPVLATHREPDTLLLGAGTWLASGIVLLGMTPIPWHGAQWGWAPAFWLLLAPALVLGVRACTMAFGAARRQPANASRRSRSTRIAGATPGRRGHARRPPSTDRESGRRRARIAGRHRS